MLFAIIFFFFQMEIEIEQCHKISYLDGPTKIKNREITGSCIIKPHLGKLPGSGNLEEFQLQLDSFSQAEQRFWIFTSLIFLLFMKTFFLIFILIYINTRFHTLTNNLGNIERLERSQNQIPSLLALGRIEGSSLWGLNVIRFPHCKEQIPQKTSPLRVTSQLFLSTTCKLQNSTKHCYPLLLLHLLLLQQNYSSPSIFFTCKNSLYPLSRGYIQPSSMIDIHPAANTAASKILLSWNISLWGEWDNKVFFHVAKPLCESVSHCPTGLS